jgi:hypothetical protein
MGGDFHKNIALEGKNFIIAQVSIEKTSKFVCQGGSSFPLGIISCTRTKNNRSVFKFSVTNHYQTNFDIINEDAG